MQRMVLWGHHLDEYRDMFDLLEHSYTMRFLEFQCGASAFQSELREQASYLMSYDDWFGLSKAEITQKIHSSFDRRLAQIKARQNEFDLSRYGSLEQLVAYRRDGMARFIQDYDKGHAEGRYLPVDSPVLPFESFFYDYALSAHHFFSDTVPQTVDYHVRTIQELIRVAKEVRIFPLVDAQGVISPLLGPVLLALQQLNYGVEIRDVRYHLQPKGNAMLRVWPEMCSV